MDEEEKKLTRKGKKGSHKANEDPEPVIPQPRRGQGLPEYPDKKMEPHSPEEHVDPPNEAEVKEQDAALPEADGTSLQQRITQLDQQFQDAKQKLAEQEQLISQLKQLAAQRKTRHASNQSIKLLVDFEDFKRLKFENSTLTDRVKVLETTSAVHQHYDILATNIRKLKSAKEVMNSSDNEKGLEEQQDQVARLSRQVEELEKAKEKGDDDLIMGLTNLEVANQRISELETKITAQFEKIQKLELELETTKAAVAVGFTNLSNANQVHTELAKMVEASQKTAEESLEKFQKELIAKDEQIHELTSDKSDLEQEAAKKIAEIQKLKDDNGNLAHEAAQKDVKIEELTFVKSNLENDLTMAQQDLKDKDEKMHKTTQSMEFALKLTSAQYSVALGASQAQYQAEIAAHAHTKSDLDRISSILAKKEAELKAAAEKQAKMDRELQLVKTNRDGLLSDLTVSNAAHELEKKSHSSTTSQLHQVSTDLAQIKMDLKIASDKQAKTDNDLKLMKTNRDQLFAELTAEKKSHASTASQLRTAVTQKEAELKAASELQAKTDRDLKQMKGNRDKVVSELTAEQEAHGRESKSHFHTKSELGRTQGQLETERANHRATQQDLTSTTQQLQTEQTNHQATAKHLQTEQVSHRTAQGQLSAIQPLLHTPGIFGNGEPASPGDFDLAFQNLTRAVHTYSTFFSQAFSVSLKTEGDASKVIEVSSRILRHAVPEFDAVLLEQYQFPFQDFRKAFLVASLVKELFVHFESETFDGVSEILPLQEVTPRALVDRRFPFRQQFDRISKCQVSELRESDLAFVSWFHSVLARLQSIWAQDDPVVWSKLFEDHQGKTGGQLWEVGRHVWGLHKLYRAFPFIRLLRVESGTPVERNLCKSHFNEDLEFEKVYRDGLTVLCMVMPGFQIDGNVDACDVIWF